MKLLKTIKRSALGLFLAATTICGGDIAYRMHFREGGEKLKADEIELCKTIFGDEIDYSKVRIVPHRFSMFQSKGVVVTLGNEIYYDFESKANPEPLSCFIHEMAHIWQNQNDIPNTGVRGALKLWWNSKEHKYHDTYAYAPDSTKTLLDYNMEQQADMIEDYHDQVEQLRKMKKQPVIVDIEKSESFYMKPVLDTVAEKDLDDKTILDSIPEGYQTIVKKLSPAEITAEKKKEKEKAKLEKEEKLRNAMIVRNTIHAQFNAAVCTWEELDKIKVKKQYRVKKQAPPKETVSFHPRFGGIAIRNLSRK